MPSKSFKVRNSFSLCQWLWFSRIKIKVLTVGRALTNAELSLWKPGTSATVRLCLDEHGLLVPALANLAPERLHQSWSMKSEASKLQTAEGREQSDSSRLELDKGSLGGKMDNQPNLQSIHRKPSPRKTAEVHPIFQAFAL